MNIFENYCKKFNKTPIPEKKKKKKDFGYHLSWKILLMQITQMQKEFVKILK